MDELNSIYISFENTEINKFIQFYLLKNTIENSKDNEIRIEVDNVNYNKEEIIEIIKKRNKQKQNDIERAKRYRSKKKE
jgi:hypothetical protein